MPNAPFPTGLPQGLCTLLDPDIVWLHLIADLATGIAYFSIPAVLMVFVLRRRDVAYPWIFGLFALFIIACGATHFMHAWTMFHPDYVLEGLIKALCAAVSLAVAILLWPLLPKFLALPSPASLAREVEERRAAEARARASEAQMATFIDHLAEALLVTRVEPDGGFTLETVNPAYERTFGLKAADLVGRRAEAVLPPAIQAAVLPRWRIAVQAGHAIDYVVEAETPLGHRIWQTTLVPIAGADGRVERLLGSARDITETRRLQAELVQSARLATVGTMCAGLAHETSQPLNAATLWLRNARAASTGVAPEARGRLDRAFGIVEGQLRRAGDLVGRIRGLAGEAVDGAGRFDATAAAAAAVQVAAGQYAPEGIAVTLQAEDGALPVWGIEGRLQGALLQLLANARDAVLDRRRLEPEARLGITVTTRRGHGQAVISVEDSGLGVPEGLREAIFDPFFTTRDPGHGSGLGLPLAVAVARGMGGRIEVSNLNHGGAKFTMRLALSPAAVSDGATEPVVT